MHEAQEIRRRNAKKKPDVPGAALLYAAASQISTLASTCLHVSPTAPVAGVQAVSIPAQEEAVPDPAQAMKDLMDAMKEQEYLNDPNAFYQKVLLAVKDSSTIRSHDVKQLFVGELKGVLAPNLSDPKSSKALGLALANAYAQTTHGSVHIEELSKYLGQLLGKESPLIKSTLLTYDNCQKSHLPIPHIADCQNQLSTNMQNAAGWQSNYTSVLENYYINGTFDSGQVGELIQRAPPGTGAQLMHLAKLNGPVGAAPPPPTPPTPAPKTPQHGPSGVSGVDPVKKWRHHIIHDMPVMMAMYILLMSGQGSYGFLAKIMANLDISMSNIKKFITAMKKLQDDINDFIKSKDKGAWASDAADIAKQQALLKGFINQYGGMLGPTLVKSLSDFADTNLDKVVSDATAGMDPPCTTWADAASRPEALQKLHDFMTGPKGGSTPASVTTLIKNLSDLMNSLNTQNQGDIEKLNLATKKVDSLTKLFSASITMYKGLVQTLSNYSGS